ncbi:MAG: hypothetical protein HY319_17755 [Armatimonadetes bacterium]|nr:hypothetical protein [Armatimonadota bacterium]
MVLMICLAIGVFLFGLGMGVLVWRNDPESPRSRISAAAFVLGGALAGWYIYSTDAAMRRQTLFETMVEGSQGVTVGAEAPVRRMTFEVEHPGTEHTLLVAPYMPAPNSPTGGAEVEVRLLDPSSGMLVQDRRVYEVRSGGRGSRGNWEAAYFPFTPTRPGPHTLELTLLTVDVPNVHVRVEDPLNTDGERIPGF